MCHTSHWKGSSVPMSDNLVGKCYFICSSGVFDPCYLFIVTAAMLDDWCDKVMKVDKLRMMPVNHSFNWSSGFRDKQTVYNNRGWMMTNTTWWERFKSPFGSGELKLMSGIPKYLFTYLRCSHSWHTHSHDWSILNS